ncbi:MAG: hypothetical protein DHS80DRAFT_19936 [Piptocephalis tieghemiana]|nr:MAG: hypothetical protein DHS80DRAFT_19936 [Piptocephalis tieghemiana]
MAPSKKKATKGKSPKNPSVKVPWPRLTPKKHLQLTEILEDQVYTLDGFLNPKECSELTKIIDSHFQLQPSPPPGRDEAFRSNLRASCEDPDFAQYLYSTTGLDCLVRHWTRAGKAPAGLNGHVRVYKYEEGQRFGRHYDESVRVPETGMASGWTLLVYLNDVASGGETIFYGPARDQVTGVAPHQGMALLHRHGEHCLLHEGARVGAGCTKYVLRSDLMFPC